MFGKENHFCIVRVAYHRANPVFVNLDVSQTSSSNVHFFCFKVQKNQPAILQLELSVRGTCLAFMSLVIDTWTWQVWSTLAEKPHVADVIQFLGRVGRPFHGQDPFVHPHNSKLYAFEFAKAIQSARNHAHGKSCVTWQIFKYLDTKPGLKDLLNLVGTGWGGLLEEFWLEEASLHISHTKSKHGLCAQWRPSIKSSKGPVGEFWSRAEGVKCGLLYFLEEQGKSSEAISYGICMFVLYLAFLPLCCNVCVLSVFF